MSEVHVQCSITMINISKTERDGVGSNTAARYPPPTTDGGSLQ